MNTPGTETPGSNTGGGKLAQKKINVSRFLNILLGLILILVVVFGWWYMKGRSPLDSIQTTSLTGVPQPKYLYTIYGPDAKRINGPYHTIATRDRIYIADSYNSRVVVCDYNGRYLFQFGGKVNKPGGMISPIWITEINNEIYVVDIDGGGISVWSPDGKFKRMLGDLHFPRPFALTYMNNKYYVTDSGTMKVYILDQNGKVIKEFGGRGDQEGQFYYTYGITARDNKLYIADSNNNRIQVFDENGKYLQTLLGKEANGAGGLSTPRGIAFDSKGNLFTAEMLSNDVAILGQDGIKQAGFTYAEPEKDHVTDQLAIPTSVFIDANNRLYVTELGKSRVLVYQL